MIENVSTRDGYDRWSSIYDDEDNPLIALETPVVEQLVGRIAGLRIADIGCGTGRHAISLARAGSEVTALDFSEGMLARAREKAAGLRNVCFLQHDLRLALPLPDAQFDRVLCCLVLDHIVDLKSFFGELGRICRLEGSVLASVMHPAMLLRGRQAAFVDPATGSEVRPESSPNQICDYVMGVLRAGLQIEAMDEYAVDAATAARCPRAEKYLGWPMLLTLKLRPKSG